MNINQELRIVPNFPKPGIEFLDISPLLENADKFNALIDQLASAANQWDFDKIAAIESRGFILGSALAHKMGRGFVMIRKKGKLPGQTVQKTYDLEYGTDTIEILPTSFKKGDKVLVLDDVLATGGTAAAAASLVEEVGGQVQACLFLIELSFLKGAQKLKWPVHSLLVK